MKYDKYTTTGMSGGSCGHIHLNLRSAIKCLKRNLKRSPFSDRTVKGVTSTDPIKIGLLDVEDTKRVDALTKELKK